ncbi:histidine kinase [Amycolatopsis bartoniae]|uniref:histidine kinase n=1 Tax=Amycolatopsis bartoniae TaxID=941986 RepID=A0A8H9MGP8_9PSEU|nr:histidine kinase [Amycolatopsis bartoniae]
MPVGQLLGQQPRRPAKWRAITRWRDWSIAGKLAAVTLVPIIIALVLGGITISNQVQRSTDFERIDRLVVLSSDVRGLVDALQQERTRTAALLSQGTVGSSPELDAARAATDTALKPLSTDTTRVTQVDSAVSAPGAASNNALARLGEVRQQVAAGQLDSVQALDAYSAMTTALLSLDTTLVAGMGDPSISGTANALHDLQVAKEEVSTSQVLVTYGIARGNLTPTQLNQLRTAEVRLADRLEDFRAAATGTQGQDFDRTVTGQDFDTRSRLVASVLAAQGVTASDALDAISGEQWTAVSNAVVDSLRAVSTRLGDQVASTSEDLVDTSGTDAGLLAVLLFAALVVTAAVVFLITRQLLRSLRLLRTSALDVADKQLPAAVRNIQEGREQSAEVTPVRVGTADEIGQVAKAFDAVHSQALRLAIEQAAMRTGYSSVFVNLSRRSQSLVQRQLQLIERLERDEEDADQLATLFQLDHLATRMRRNNENLMVLSGAEPGRRSGQPITIADVLRAAVSEIEQYQRVVVQPPPDGRIVGYAASDLMRLIAELLDNATAFSAPETQVTVATRVADNGALVVDIMDKGIGMNEAEVAEANARLTEAATVDLATSRRMGLFVVGRLAGRHRIGVTLHGGKDIVGVRATVTVPADLVMGLPQAVPAPAPEFPQDPALPRRRTVNGAGRAGALTSLAGTAGTLGDGAAAPEPWTQNGHTGLLPPRPSDVEVSGTALFSPIQPDEQDVPAQPESPEDLPGGALPAGKALFEANTSSGALTEWWSAAAAEPAPPPPPPSPRETTPIFDETLSAWFRSDRPAPAPAAGASGKAAEATASAASPAEAEETAEDTKASTGWDFAVDENFRAVQAVSQAEPTSFTEAGLPRRRRGEQLMPGSATSAEPESTESAPASSVLPTRDPADIRGRLSSFQRGISRARHAARDDSATQAGGPERPAGASGLSQGSAGAGASGLTQGPAGAGASGLPQRSPAEQSWPDADQAAAAEANPLPQRRPAGESRRPEGGLPQRQPGGEGALPRRQPGGSAAFALPQPSGESLFSTGGRGGESTSRQSGGEDALSQRQSRGESALSKRQPGGEGAPERQSGGEGALPQRQSGEDGARRSEGGDGSLSQRRPAGEGDLARRGQEAGESASSDGEHGEESALPRRQRRESAFSPGNEEELPQRQGGEGGLPRRKPTAGSDLPQQGDESGLPRRRGSEAGLPQRQGSESGLAQEGDEQGLPQRQGGESGLPQRQGAESGLSEQGLPQRGGDTGLPRRRGGESGLPQESTDTGLPQRRGGESGLPQRQTGATGLPQRQGSDTGLPRRQPTGVTGETPLPRRQPPPDRTATPAAGAGNPPRRHVNEPPRRLEPPEEPAETSGAFLWRKPQEFPEDSQAPLPRRQQGEPQPEAVGAEPAWSFATDESWRTVEAVSQSAPVSYTAAGLPRRRRGEQLLPGSASSAGVPGARTQRDPQDVRGRLNSFQQGVRRGRHRTAQPAESDHETMEGE